MLIMNGMPREATQEFGGVKSPAVVEEVCAEVRLEEVVPEMRAASSRTSSQFRVEESLKKLEGDSTFVQFPI